MSKRRKIKDVSINNRMKNITIILSDNSKFSMPFSRLRLKPRVDDKMTSMFVDKELASEAITYFLESGKTDSIHYDAFLDYNCDPGYLHNLWLYNVTIAAKKVLEKSQLSKNEVIRRLKTSPSQFYRLIDQTNYTKSIDEMLRLLTVLGCDVEIKIKQKVA